MFRIRLKFKPTKKILVIAGCTILTLANAGGLGFVILKNNKQPAPTTVLQELVTPKISVTNAKKREVDVALQGKKIGTGSYKSETLPKSKITTGTPAKLVIAAHEPTGGHFVLAFLNKGNIPGVNQLEPGWNLQAIADDPMWAPGACSSKPSFLVENKYIFIDDGKTNPDDLYSSYVMFDMHTGQYRYFGGNNFTETQGKKENILLAVNENDKIVFYIDPVDNEPYFAYPNATPGHERGKDHAYIIRREIDPDTLSYTDYSLPFSVPEDLPLYNVYAYNGSDGVQFSFSAPYNGMSGISYTGILEANSIKLALLVPDSYNLSNGYPYSSDSKLELALDSALRASLPSMTDQKVSAGSESKTLFNASELGSFQSLQFLNITQRFGQTIPNGTEYYATPLIYDSQAKQLYPMVTAPLLIGYSDYVNLGVF